MSLGVITAVEVTNSDPTTGANRFSSEWGVVVNDYTYNSVAADFETLLVEISTVRASTIEAEIDPLQKQVTRRNNQLEELGNALSNMSKCQASFDSDAEGTDYTNPSTTPISEETYNTIYTYFGGGSGTSYIESDSSGYKISKQNCEEVIQLIKTKVDKLNNDSQTDLTRLQSLVDKRDDSYSTASSLMQSISDTRSNVIKNNV